MRKRALGSLHVSELGVGCNNFGRKLDEQRSANVVNAALDAGVNLFDTADAYSQNFSEQHLGAALRGRRDEAIVATKFGKEAGLPNCGASPEYVRTAVEASLKRLGTDRIDLYQLHAPDPATPIADTLGELASLVEAGKIVEIGCSNFDADQLREAHAAAVAVRFVSVQNRYSMLTRDQEREVIPACQQLGISLVPYWPLENGLLTGKYASGDLPSGTRLAEMTNEARARALDGIDLTVISALTQFAEERGHTLLDLAFAWLLHEPVVASVIAGATSPAQIAANAEATGYRLTTADVDQLDTILRPASDTL